MYIFWKRKIFTWPICSPLSRKVCPWCNKQWKAGLKVFFINFLFSIKNLTSYLHGNLATRKKIKNLKNDTHPMIVTCLHFKITSTSKWYQLLLFLSLHTRLWRSPSMTIIIYSWTFLTDDCNGISFLYLN